MSAPSIPPDNSASIRQMELDSQRQAQEKADAAAAARKQELAGLRTNAATTGRQSANDYFTGRGLDPNEYQSDIDSRINSILGSIAPDDPNPGSYFTNAGASAYTSAEESSRMKAQRSLDALFPSNFETSRVPLTLDDPYLTSIEAEQRTKADDIIRNMLQRGVITPTGYDAAVKDLDKQAPGVRSRLGEIGTTSLTAEQEALRGISNKGRQTAQTLNLGTKFDAGTYGSEADQNFANFISTLGDTLRSKAPGNLFNTAGLGAIAGAGQGAQNTAFDPAALSGVTEEDPTKKTSTTKESIF